MKIIVILLILICGFSYLSVIEYNKIEYFYRKENIKCSVISKNIRQYNARPDSRSGDLQYKNVLICDYIGNIFDVNVSNGLFYKTKIGDTVYLKLSMSDIYGYMPTKKFLGISCSGNIKFILVSILLMILIVNFILYGILNFSKIKNDIKYISF